MAAEEKKIRYDRETEIAYSKLQDALDMAEIIFCEYDIKNNVFVHRSRFHENIGIDHNVQTMGEVENDDVTILLEDKHKNYGSDRSSEERNTKSRDRVPGADGGGLPVAQRTV